MTIRPIFVKVDLVRLEDFNVSGFTQLLWTKEEIYLPEHNTFEIVGHGLYERLYGRMALQNALGYGGYQYFHLCGTPTKPRFSFGRIRLHSSQSVNRC